MTFINVSPALRRQLRTTFSAAAMLTALPAVLISPAHAENNSAHVKLYDASNNQIGDAKLTQVGQGNVVVDVKVHDLPAGYHGFHVHAVGECTPPAFTSAGGHFDLDSHNHRDHSGDFPVLLVGADGTASVRFNTDRFTVGDLFDSDGSAMIIHAGPDNYANIPTRYVSAPDATTLATGDAGGRIACGVIERSVIKR